MTDNPEHVPVEETELVEADQDAASAEGEFIEQPAKVMRVGSMLRQLLDELKEVTLDEGSRDRMREIYDTSVQELGSALSPDLSDELNRITLPFGNDEIPSEAELRVAQAQLVGWLEGLIQRDSSHPFCATDGCSAATRQYAFRRRIVSWFFWAKPKHRGC